MLGAAFLSVQYIKLHVNGLEEYVVTLIVSLHVRPGLKVI